MADEQKFTPGPWKVQECTGCGNYEVHAREPLMGSSYTDEGIDSETTILRCHFISEVYSGAVRREADARLIAASPTMIKYIAMHALLGDNEAILIVEEALGNAASKAIEDGTC